MSKLAYISHPIYLKHNTGTYHPESASRLIAIDSKLKESGLFKKIEIFEPETADQKIISTAHDLKYINKIKSAIENGEIVLDQGDTIASQQSFEAAKYAVGAAIKGIDLIKSENFNKVFCAVRPPGHHAEYDYAKGFCIFNNIAIAAKYAQQVGLAEKILIVDWDVHHGNGTQHIFEKDDSVFYFSIHQFPFYPGTGSHHEVGSEKGTSFTLNSPMKSGSTDSDYCSKIELDLKFIQKRFKPDLVLISAGFDAHRDDPLAGILLTEKGFIQMTELVSKLAWKYCDGRVLSILEGGYNLNALASSVEAHLDVLLKH